MTNICENERCTYHRPLPVKDAGAPYIDTIEDGERVRVERHLYISRDGSKRDFFLCDVCHAAVEMVVTPNVENQAGEASPALPGSAARDSERG